MGGRGVLAAKQVAMRLCGTRGFAKGKARQADGEVRDKGGTRSLFFHLFARSDVFCSGFFGGQARQSQVRNDGRTAGDAYNEEEEGLASKTQLRDGGRKRH